MTLLKTILSTVAILAKTMIVSDAGRSRIVLFGVGRDERPGVSTRREDFTGRAAEAVFGQVVKRADEPGRVDAELLAAG